jgi:hypothetical protein
MKFASLTRKYWSWKRYLNIRCSKVAFPAFQRSNKILKIYGTNNTRNLYGLVFSSNNMHHKHEKKTYTKALSKIRLGFRYANAIFNSEDWIGTTIWKHDFDDFLHLCDAYHAYKTAEWTHYARYLGVATR